LLFTERAYAAMRIWRWSRDAAAWWLPFVHLFRDVAWVTAIAVWLWRLLAGRRAQPGHSMSPRRPRANARQVTLPRNPRVLGVLPAHNEIDNLPAVVNELRRLRPDLHLLIVDDGSTDGTERLLADLGVAWLRWRERRGVGAAIRAGLVYASRLEFDLVVRVDADGQHGVADIDSLLQPIRDGRAEVVLGTRYTAERPPRWPGVGVVKRVLAACLSIMTGGRVTDPTSGFCAFGPRAIKLLAEHHPDGYPEPELRLFLSRNEIRVAEVPVADRPRLSGRTSLTWRRVLGAGARVVLAMLIVPFRPVVTRLRD
jgi:glycosyltransferase involved in cell wall biosynthesis